MSGAFVSAVYAQDAGIPMAQLPGAHGGQLNAGGGPLVQLSGAGNISTLQYAGGSITVVPSNGSGTAAKSNIFVTVSLKPATPVGPVLNALSNPARAGYGGAMTPSMVTSLFGQPNSTYGKVAGYFQSYGLSVYPGVRGLSMTLGGNFSQVGAAFHTSIREFSMVYNSSGSWLPLFGNGSGVKGSISSVPFYANTEPSYLPSSISCLVAGVAGLSSAYLQPSISLPQGMSPGMKFGPGTSGAAPSLSGIVSNRTSLYYLNGTYGYLNASESSSLGFPASNYQLLFPGTLPVLTGARNLWDGSSAVGHLPDLGQNITVALIEVGLIDPAVIQQFSSQVFHNQNQITDRMTQIPLLGATVQSGLNYGWSLETALDIEYLATMAPKAHIDLIGIPYPEFSLFDYAYSYTAQNLVTRTNASTSVTITSNSYGAGEYDLVAGGSPMYLTVENDLLGILALEGVTSFFASGDSGTGNTASQAGVPAVAAGSTSVGGGQLTAMSNGQTFPGTGVFTYFNSSMFNLSVRMVNATGVASFSYWYYPGYAGAIAGGFGQSIGETQPWWQNALDTYSTGAKIDPVISGAAAFNMTAYMNGWQLFYGGTSFATPITAGEWALVEEQVNLTLGMTTLGDINPLLFSVHNAYQATGNTTFPDAYVRMSGNGASFDSYYVNSISWNMYNLSVGFPSDPVLPEWFPSLNNPAGSGWNYLQGLGMPNATLFSRYLTGNSLIKGNGILHTPFEIVTQNSTRGFAPFTVLTGNTAHSFMIRTAGSFSGTVNISEYSGGTNEGLYGGGTVTQLNSLASGSTFSYTPAYVNRLNSSQSPEYGYFYITAGNNWSFQFYAIQPGKASGVLKLGATDAYGNFETSSVNVPMISVLTPGQLNTMYSVNVFLNGQPMPDANVTETALNVNYNSIDPSLNASSYSSGAVIGNFLTDLRGSTALWTNAFIAAGTGAIPTQVFTVQASYNGLHSNVLTVYVEPQGASYLATAHIDNSTGTVSGNVTFNDLKYVNYINVSLQGSAGQFGNTSFPVHPAGGTGVSLSNVSNGLMPFSFRVPATANSTLNISIKAEGANVEQSAYFSAGAFRIFGGYTQNPIFWEYTFGVSNTLALSPFVSMSSTSGPLASGIVTLAFHTSHAPAGSSAEMILNTVSSSSLIASGLQLNGTYSWNTTNLPDGNYTVVFLVTTSTGLSGMSGLNFYLENGRLRSISAFEQISVIEKSIAYVDNGLSRLKSEINAGGFSASSVNKQISLLQGNLTVIDAEIGRLAGLVGSTNATVVSLSTQVAYLKAEVSDIQYHASLVSSQQNLLYELMQPLVMLTVIALTLAGFAAGALYAKRKQGGPGGKRS